MVNHYPCIKKLGVKIYNDPYPHVKWTELHLKLEELDIVKKFNEFYGCQTCCEGGPYAHDVEAVLERIKTGKLTGTQLFWD
jgi:hypothetical protein